MSYKSFKAVLLIAIIVVSVGWSFNQNKKETRMSELALANVEALAGFEDPNEGKGKQKVECKEGNRITGAKCEDSASSSSVCHYQNDTWGKCN